MTTTYQAPHEVRDAVKLAAMVDALRRGESLPPVVVEPNGVRAITGSHRLAAWAALGMEPDALELTDDQYRAACEYYGVEYLDELDMEDACRAVYETCGDEAIRAALADQV